MGMTSHEFEALKRWIGSRTAIAVEIKGREYDKPFVEARKRDLQAADDAAQSALVTPQVTDEPMADVEVEDTQP
jgi:hypothetical protein